MIYKVLYQADKIQGPTRETTQTLYLKAESDVAARQLVEDNTPYNIELVQALSDAHLAYEQAQPDFKLTEF